LTSEKCGLLVTVSKCHAEFPVFTGETLFTTHYKNGIQKHQQNTVPTKTPV